MQLFGDCLAYLRRLGGLRGVDQSLLPRRGLNVVGAENLGSRTSFRQDVDNAVRALEGRADQCFIEGNRHVDAAIRNALVGR